MVEVGWDTSNLAVLTGSDASGEICEACCFTEGISCGYCGLTPAQINFNVTGFGSCDGCYGEPPSGFFDYVSGNIIDNFILSQTGGGGCKWEKKVELASPDRFYRSLGDISTGNCEIEQFVNPMRFLHIKVEKTSNTNIDISFAYGNTDPINSNWYIMDAVSYTPTGCVNLASTTENFGNCGGVNTGYLDSLTFDITPV